MPFARSERAEIYYEASGEGPALVFAHGAGGNRISWWQQVPVFQDRFRVIAIDHRGFGRSACEADAFHPKHFGEDLRRILDQEGISRAALVCQSMGGWTGLRFARDFPERVRALILCGTPGGLISPKVLEAAARIGSTAQEEGIRGNAALAPDYPKRRPDMAALYDHIAGLNTGFEPSWLGRMFEPEGRIEADELSGFSVPTLILAGEQDQLFPPEALRETASLIPGAELREFPELGHSTYFEDAGAFNAAVSAFLDQNP